MDAKEQANIQYNKLCAQYAHTGFQLEDLVKQRRQIKADIVALETNLPLLVQAEKDAQQRAKEAQDAKDNPPPVPTPLSN